MRLDQQGFAIMNTIYQAGNEQLWPMGVCNKKPDENAKKTPPTSRNIQYSGRCGSNDRMKFFETSRFRKENNLRDDLSHIRRIRSRRER